METEAERRVRSEGGGLACFWVSSSEAGGRLYSEDCQLFVATKEKRGLLPRASARTPTAGISPSLLEDSRLRELPDDCCRD